MGKPHIKLKATADSFQNFAARVGINTGNIGDCSGYGFNPISRNRVQVEFTYRGSWIAGMAVDCIAEDMTREGVEIHGDDSPDDLQALERAAGRLQLWKKLTETIKWSRLYGGAVCAFMIDGQQFDTPLRPETVGLGQFKGLLPLDRWMVQPTLSDLITDFGPDYGKPKFYDVLPDTVGMPRMRVHHSRLIRIEGVELPYWQRIAENGWGQSVLERLWDRLVAFDSVTQGMAQLVYKAHLRTYSVEGLRDIIAAGGPAMGGLVKQIDMIRKFQSNEGMTLMDAKDKFEAHQYSFSGLSDVILQLGQQISGALQIPLVRLFGQSPQGMSATGESDLRMYYDNIRQQQEARLRHGIEPLYELLYRSTFGRPAPAQFAISFKPLWQMSDDQSATVTNTLTTAIVGAYEAQIIDRGTAMRELKQIAGITGAYSNITDEAIKEADSDPAPSPEMLGLEAAKPEPGSQESDPGADENAPGGTKLRAAA